MLGTHSLWERLKTADLSYSPPDHPIASEEREALLALSLSEGYLAHRLPGREIHSKSDLLDWLDRQFGFPSYFSSNWDSAMECWATVLRASEKPIILEISESLVLASTLGDQFEAFMEVAGTVVERSSPKLVVWLN